MTDLQVVALLVAVGGLVALGWLIWSRGKNEWVDRNRVLLLPLVLVGVMGGLVLALVGAMIPGTPVFQMGVGIFELPLLLTVLGILAVPAWYVLRARDARRFAVSAVVVAALWFVVFYPNFCGPAGALDACSTWSTTRSARPATGASSSRSTTAPASSDEGRLAVADRRCSAGACCWSLVGAAFYAARSLPPTAGRGAHGQDA